MPNSNTAFGRVFDRECLTKGGHLVCYRRLPQPIGEFVYEGRLAVGPCATHLWQEDGSWALNESPEATPYDLDLTTAQGATTNPTK